MVRNSYPILGEVYKPEDYCHINLAEGNEEFRLSVKFDPELLGNHIKKYCRSKHSKIVYGGYKEKRFFYAFSPIFHAEKEIRNIHLGVDLWVESESAIHAPIEGIIYGFANNNNPLDYGPTIIMFHPEINYFALYGHLSMESLKNKKINQSVSKSEIFARVGTSRENGGWPSHLHFQLIKDMSNYRHDYPGVSSESKASFFLQNCPDPTQIALGFSDNL